MTTDDPIVMLRLPGRCMNALLRQHIYRIADLLALTSQQLLTFPQLGAGSVFDIKRKLAEYGLALADDIEARAMIGV